MSKYYQRALPAALVLVLSMLFFSGLAVAESNEYLVKIDDSEFTSGYNLESEDEVNKMKSKAETTQRNFREYTEESSGVQIKNSFWISNTVVVELENISPETLERHPDVERVTENHEVRTMETYSGKSSKLDIVASESYDTTYGLEHLNTTKVWEEYNDKGENTKVAVLDTGVEPDHPDIDLYTEDSDDPTYPGGWALFDSNGNKVSGSEPEDFDTEGSSTHHGTHVSGTVSGENHSGSWIGVAPGSKLLHGAVLTDCDSTGCGGTADQILSGIQWAVEQEADIISMSLGTICDPNPIYVEDYIDPIRNAEDAGITFVAAIGNDGEDCSGSPGNIYDSLSVGASNQNHDIESFSGGELIDTDDAWGNDAPSDWPDEYIVPSISAPGASVFSSISDNDHSFKSGTSMATPHISGAIALMQSLTVHEYSPEELKNSIYQTSWKPSDWSEPEDERDTRYGYGIADAKAATEHLLRNIEVDLEACESVRHDTFNLQNKLTSNQDCLQIEGHAIINGDNHDIEGDFTHTGLKIEEGSPKIHNLNFKNWDLDIKVSDGNPEIENISFNSANISKDGFLDAKETKIGNTSLNFNGTGFNISKTKEIEMPETKTNSSDFLEINGDGWTHINKSFQKQEHLEESQVGLYRHTGDETDPSNWQEVEDTDIDLETGTLSTNLTEFSTFTVLSETGDFKIEEIDSPDYKIVSETLETTVEINNTDEQTGTQDIKLEKNGETRDSEELTVEPSENKQVTLKTNLTDTGLKQFNITTFQDNESFTTEILEEPQLEIQGPGNNSEFNWTNREIDFSVKSNFDEPSNHTLYINNKKKEFKEISEIGEHEFQITQELGEGSFSWNLTSKGLNSGFENTTQTRKLNIEENAVFEIIEPSNQSEIKYTEDDKINFSIDSENDGELTLNLSDKNHAWNHKTGKEYYNKSFNLEPGNYKWNLTFESELGNIFKSKNRFFEKKKPSINFSNINPVNHTVLAYEDREVDFKTDFEPEIETNISLIINETIKHNWNQLEEKQELLYTQELEPGEYTWYFNGSTYTNQNSSGERHLEILNKSNFESEIIKPEEGEEFDESEDIEFKLDVSSDIGGEVKLKVDGETIQEFSYSEGFNTTETHETSLNEGSYAARIVFETEAGIDTESPFTTFEVETEEDDSSSSGGGGGAPPADEEDGEEDESDTDETTETVEETQASVSISKIEKSPGESSRTEFENSFLDALTITAVEEITNGTVSITQEDSDDENHWLETSFKVETLSPVEASFERKIEQDWFEDKNIEPENVSFLKKEDYEWQKIETQLETDSDSYIYTSNRTSLSKFALGAEKPTVYGMKEDECQKFRGEIPENWTEIETCQEAHEQSEEQPTSLPLTLRKAFTLLITLAIITVATILIHLRNQKIEHQIDEIKQHSNQHLSMNKEYQNQKNKF